MKKHTYIHTGKLQRRRRQTDFKDGRQSVELDPHSGHETIARQSQMIKSAIEKSGELLNAFHRADMQSARSGTYTHITAGAGVGAFRARSMGSRFLDEQPIRTAV